MRLSPPTIQRTQHSFGLCNASASRPDKALASELGAPLTEFADLAGDRFRGLGAAGPDDCCGRDRATRGRQVVDAHSLL